MFLIDDLHWCKEGNFGVGLVGGHQFHLILLVTLGAEHELDVRDLEGEELHEEGEVVGVEEQQVAHEFVEREGDLEDGAVVQEGYFEGGEDKHKPDVGFGVDVEGLVRVDR